ncbi:ribosomal-processing cysteine protease Prp [Effusibacillus dendaii]|uniref:Ribosomal processing cysteine protease Prp n=1 Tax=Effusibacillus dendaii TaxID=2743772 RepID=A0A7I8DB14_9BACL|nr:ribosomal-processing cysteine protease Prp [Effusibacillus dendaii]BCJ86026.1 hypothetical protein skT53_10110 [Effusibacillus dendaii]
MIQVNIHRDWQGHIDSFRAAGHSLFAENGNDIVCAAVSILVQNCVNSIETLLHVTIPAVSKDGLVECKIPPLDDSLAKQVQLLLESMAYGLRTLAESYPKHVSVVDND